MGESQPVKGDGRGCLLMLAALGFLYFVLLEIVPFLFWTIRTGGLVSFTFLGACTAAICLRVWGNDSSKSVSGLAAAVAFGVLPHLIFVLTYDRAREYQMSRWASGYEDLVIWLHENLRPLLEINLVWLVIVAAVVIALAAQIKSASPLVWFLRYRDWGGRILLGLTAAASFTVFSDVETPAWSPDLDRRLEVTLKRELTKRLESATINAIEADLKSDDSTARALRQGANSICDAIRESFAGPHATVVDQLHYRQFICDEHTNIKNSLDDFVVAEVKQGVKAEEGALEGLEIKRVDGLARLDELRARAAEVARLSADKSPSERVRVLAETIAASSGVLSETVPIASQALTQVFAQSAIEALVAEAASHVLRHVGKEYWPDLADRLRAGNVEAQNRLARFAMSLRRFAVRTQNLSETVQRHLVERIRSARKMQENRARASEVQRSSPRLRPRPR